VIGLKKYEQDRVPDLLFADADAREFAKFLASERGGKAEIITLLNEQARSSEIRLRITELMAKLHKDDTLVFFVAAHGEMRDDVPYIVTYRANPQDTTINGLPLTEIQKLRFGEKKTWRQVRVFLDICHGGNIALLDAAAMQSKRPAVHPPPAEFLALTATHQGPDALAYEDPKFGHGVFTYFLLRGLATGEARQSESDNYITAVGLSNFVETWVQKATTSARDGKPRQKPTSLIGVGMGHEIADLRLAGPEFKDTRPLASMVIPPERLGKLRRQLPPVKKEAPILPPDPADPGNVAQGVALEDEGEEILLRYLQGDEIPQDRAAFVRGAVVFGEALRLRPGSPYLEARKVFCEGRVEVFDRHWDDAITKLEQSIRLDPSAAYAYNALGIAYLEKGDFGLARLAFEDAIDRAPRWAYPRHNLALVHTQAGNYEQAIAAYRAAQERAPDYFYLPYNLGLLFQRMNRPDDAEKEYQVAFRNASRNTPGRAEPLIALGVLKANQRKWKDSESYYRRALALPSAELTRRTARHNLAVLLARRPATWPEAERLWMENGSYLPTQLALAHAYGTRGRTAEAISKYREVLSEVPDHLSARIELANQLEKSGEFDAAAAELRAALNQQPGNTLLMRHLAAALTSSGRRTEALALLNAANRGTDDRSRSRARASSTAPEEITK
jgi:tetratricopeptide (TPR) repeat protein